MPQMKVNELGYQQILWLFGADDYITEVGTMNFFGFVTNRDGVDELVTPPLDGTILPGVTRDSIIQLSKEWGIPVYERPMKMKELIDALKEGRVKELFGAGTAAIVSPIKRIWYNGKDWEVPLDPQNKKAEAGPLTTRFADRIMAIQYGEVPNHPWSVVIN